MVPILTQVASRCRLADFCGRGERAAITLACKALLEHRLGSEAPNKFEWVLVVVTQQLVAQTCRLGAEQLTKNASRLALTRMRSGNVVKIRIEETGRCQERLTHDRSDDVRGKSQALQTI